MMNEPVTRIETPLKTTLHLGIDSSIQDLELIVHELQRLLERIIGYNEVSQSSPAIHQVVSERQPPLREVLLEASNRIDSYRVRSIETIREIEHVLFST
jgi:hypothetical protein